MFSTWSERLDTGMEGQQSDLLLVGASTLDSFNVCKSHQEK